MISSEEYESLMREINECLNALIDQTDPHSEQVNLPAIDEEADRLPEEADRLPEEADRLPEDQAHMSPAYQDPPETSYSTLAGERIIRDIQGVRWAMVKARGVPGHFFRRLPIIKTAYCGYCFQQISGQSHMKCMSLMGRANWKMSTHLTQVKRNPATLF